MTTWQRLEAGNDERRLCLAINRWGTWQALKHCFRVISRLGDGIAWYALMVLLATFGGTRGVYAALQMACAGVIATLFYRHLKRWTRRPRPYRTHPDITAYIAPLDEFSFPSGHTLHAVTFTIIATAWFPGLLPPLAVLAALIGLSRVVLGLHYPSDVLAATMIGSALARGTLWLFPVR